MLKSEEWCWIWWMVVLEVDEMMVVSLSKRDA